MNITTKSINDEGDRLYKLRKAKNNQLRNEEEKQFLEEDALTKSGSACRKSTLDKISFGMNNIDEVLLKNEIDKRFYSPATMIAAMCVTDSTFYVPNNSLGTLLKLKKWIHGLKRIGAASAAGVALKADLGPAEGMFILKAPQGDKTDNSELIHEMMIGMYGTNKLRGTIPNFSYIYGGFSCASPILNDNNEVVSWCTGKDKESVTYTIYENIAPAIDWKEYVEKCSGEEFVSGYLQVLYALAEAVKQIDFTHYDLHWNNVLMREYPSESGYFQIKYNTENGEEYLVTDRVATIIDYGNSHIAYKGKHYGKYGLLDLSVYPDRSHPFHDAYKLLMFTILAAWEGKNQSVLDEAAKIYKFFNSHDDPTFAADEQFEPYRYAVPFNMTKDLTLFDLTKFIREQCVCPFINPTPGTEVVLACIEGCPTIQSIFTDIGLDVKENYTASSFFEFYEIFQATGKKSDMNYEALRDNFENQLSDEYEDMLKDLENIKVVDLTTINVLDDVAGYAYMNFLYQLVNVLDRYNTYLLELYIGQQVVNMFEQDVDYSEFTSLDGQFKKLVAIVEGNEKLFSRGKTIFKDKKLNKHFQVAERIMQIYDVVMKE